MAVEVSQEKEESENAADPVAQAPKSFLRRGEKERRTQRILKERLEKLENRSSSSDFLSQTETGQKGLDGFGASPAQTGPGVSVGKPLAWQTSLRKSKGQEDNVRKARVLKMDDHSMKEQSLWPSNSDSLHEDVAIAVPSQRAPTNTSHQGSWFNTLNEQQKDSHNNNIKGFERQLPYGSQRAGRPRTGRPLHHESQLEEFMNLERRIHSQSSIPYEEDSIFDDGLLSSDNRFQTQVEDLNSQRPQSPGLEEASFENYQDYNDDSHAFREDRSSPENDYDSSLDFLRNRIKRDLRGDQQVAESSTMDSVLKENVDPIRKSKANEAQPSLNLPEDEIEILRGEIRRYKEENDKLRRLRSQTEAKARKLDIERRDFERRQQEAFKAFEEYKVAEQHKLKRDKRVMDKQSREMMKIATKKERSECERLEDDIKKLKEDLRVQSARSKLNAERLRTKIKELEQKNLELVEELKVHESLRVEKLRDDPLENNGPSDDRQATVSGGGPSGPDHAKSNRKNERSHRREGQVSDEKHKANTFLNKGVAVESHSRSMRRSPRSEGEVTHSSAFSGLKPESTLPAVEYSNHGSASDTRIRHNNDAASFESQAHPEAVLRFPSRTIGPIPEFSYSFDQLDEAQAKEYQDGRVEMEFITGERRITFQNGTIKDIVPAHFTITRFPNGDLKRTFPNKGQGLDYDCRVDYYYNEVDTWHVSFQDGSETFHFPGGQTETHIKDGPKEVLFPDGLLRIISENGTEIDSYIPFRINSQ